MATRHDHVPAAPVRRRRTQAERRNTTREAVVGAAIQVIARKGLSGATIQEIARAAGLSTGALQYHFPARDELLGPVIDRCVARLAGELKAAFEQTAPPAERLRSTLRTMVRQRLSGTDEMIALVELVARSA